MSQTSAIPPSVASAPDVTSADNSQSPTTAGTSKFGQIMGKLATTAASIAAPGLGGVLGGRLTSALNNDPMQYLQMQNQMLSEARAFETISNVQKAKHDSAMAAIRNMLPQ